MNHLAKGGFQSSAFVHGFIHDSSLACFSQKRTGLRLASACSEPSLTRAFLTKSFGGRNFRPSLSSASMGSARPVAFAMTAPRVRVMVTASYGGDSKPEPQLRLACASRGARGLPPHGGAPRRALPRTPHPACR